MKEYFNYHKHTHYSNIYTVDSNTKIQEYIDRSIELNHTSFSTCEHGSMGSIFEAKMLCENNNLKCIPVAEYYIVENPFEKDKRNYHIIVAPKTDEARKKVNYISSLANIEGYYYKPRISPQWLIDNLNPDDIYITTACMAGIIRDDYAINNIFLPLFNYFGNNVFLEVQNHDSDLQRDINKKAIELSKEYGLKLIAANDSHYINEEGKNERLTLLAGKDITYDDEDSFNLDYPDYDTFFERFIKQGVLKEDDIECAIDNTMVLTTSEEILLDKSIKMPTIDPDMTPAERVEKLKKLVSERFKTMILSGEIDKNEIPMYREELRKEMKTIVDTNEVIHTADYFLFNTKMIDLAVNKYNGVLTRGSRGSAGGFLINKLLGITQLDRLHIDLPIYPERFMSTARLLENRSMPDIDYNVAEPEPFDKAMKELLGEHGCYPMWSPGNMQEKEAFKNYCRAKKIDFEQSNKVSQNIDSYRDDPEWKPIIEESHKYIGTIISGSIHPCSRALDNKDLRYEYGVVRLGDNLVVLMTSSEADYWKILKNDILQVEVWRLISKTFEAIDKPIMSAKELLSAIKDDDKIWKLIADGKTATLNQLDSDNGKMQAQRYGIKSFEEGALVSAAIRPSFDSWREKFLNREEYSTGSKQLDEVLSMTGGFILFQENLMQYFEWLGVSPSESIGIIKKISKKKIKQKDFDDLEDRIRKTWIEKTGSEDMFDCTWKMIQSCISYGFCAAHAAAVSLDMCYGAYLKVHHPLQYYTVCLNEYANDKEETTKITSELPYFRIKLKSVEFGHSKADYSYEESGNIINKGLASIKFLSATMASDLYELAHTKEYTNFIDLLVDIYDKKICDTRQLDILTKINFFKKFGEINKLLAETKIFYRFYGRKQMNIEALKEICPEYLIDKYCDCKTAKGDPSKVAKFIDTNGLIKELCDHVEYNKTTIKDIVRYEVECLDSVKTLQPKAPDDVYVIINMEGEKNNILTLCRLCDGEILKIKSRAYKSHKPELGLMIKILKIDQERKWRLNEEGKWYQIDDKEDILKSYYSYT